LYYPLQQKEKDFLETFIGPGLTYPEERSYVDYLNLKRKYVAD